MTNLVRVTDAPAIKPPHPAAGLTAYQCRTCKGISYPPHQDPNGPCPYCSDNDDREQARDQLEAATVRAYQQMRTDQERIAELERELAEAQQGITKLIQTIAHQYDRPSKNPVS